MHLERNLAKYNQIEGHYCSNGLLYCVEIDNLSLDRFCFDKLNETIKCFLEDGDVFFGFYRTDGLYLNSNEFKKYSVDIPLFFKENGEYIDIVQEIQTRRKRKIYSGFLMVARTVSNQKLFNKLQWIFKYYLETSFFSPKISFSKFFDIHSNYMHQSSNIYLLDGYTDFLFSFYDSNRFSIMFDPQKQDIDFVCDTIKNIWSNTDENNHVSVSGAKGTIKGKGRKTGDGTVSCFEKQSGDGSMIDP